MAAGSYISYDQVPNPGDVGSPKTELAASTYQPRFKVILAKTLKCLRQHWWVWELCSATISIVATFVLITTLADADGRPLRAMSFGTTQFSLNSYVAAMSTIIRTSLLATVAGPLNQSVWNWFSLPRREEGTQNPLGRPLTDLDIFGNAAWDSWSSLQLIVRTRLR